ncbi:hypothetical protein N7470_004444 [Penicillium chermesinum]|nr:hypothetical protein N7470_004444 [Penicillium chermesinum]
MNNPMIATYQPDPSRDWGARPIRAPMADQSTHLPEVGVKVHFPRNPFHLRVAEDFDEWHTEVKGLLHGWGLDALIDIKIPRPETTNPGPITGACGRWLSTMTNIMTLSDNVLYIDRTQYQSTASYVLHLRDNYTAAWRAGVEIQPQLVLGRLFRQIQGELPFFVQALTEDLNSRGNVWAGINFEFVIAFCNATVDMLRG